MITDKDKLRIYKKAGDRVFLGNRRTRYDSRPETIHTVCSRGLAGKLECLIAQGSDVNAIDKLGNTPLHKAVSYGHKDIVKMLLEAGADANVKNIDNESPVWWALCLQNKDMVAILAKAEKI